MARWDRSARAALLLVSFLALTACGAEDGVAPELAPLVGTWNATMARFTHKENPAQSIDVVRQLSAVVTMDIRPDGRVVLTLVAFGAVNTQSGRARVEGSDLVLVPDDSTLPQERFRYQIDGGVLILDGDSEWDFNLDGTREPALLHLVLVRN